ncbi:MAG TPA: MFS transporter [Anaerolineales bacterium]|nr:MFS transporter [Anaerolineales bacterium]HMX75543.1 MFS transporter [Anaerolineales bacterium]HNA56141.1 MFS transporter [Anaerolineales bacterium]HND93716.1 MFS transporter [Anaerolineales bacterium]HNE70428.1 MFS transporter [Anaerolineales bacterium]
MNTQYKLYPYRWVVLAAFAFINLTIQTLWIAYAPITGPAAKFYGVTDLQIGYFAMSFMIAFVPLSIPVSWLIDTYGFRIAVSIGAILMGIFGIVRGFAGANYTLALWSTFGLAAAQPFLLNAWTKVPANWFAMEERATAVGIVTLGNLVGTALGMVLTPILLESMTIPNIQLMYGGVAAFSAVLFVLLARETPPTPPCAPGQEVRALMLDGLKYSFTVKAFWFTLLVSFIGLGIFNGVTTWIEGIIRPRGFSPTDAGTLGALMIVGGVIGAVLMPALSDKQRKRQLFLYIAFLGSIPGMAGLTYATSSTLLYASAFVLGFFLTSAMPIAMQYAAEVTHPTPEGTSNGLIQLFGQGAVVFVYIMEAMKSADGSFTPALLLAMGLLLASLFFVSQMKDKAQ